MVRKKQANIDADHSTPVRLATVRLRIRNSRSGTSGAAVRPSMTAKAASASAAAASATKTRTDAQPTWPALDTRQAANPTPA